jgi:hypothetical protein
MQAITFESGGREFALRMDMNAMARYQDRSGETISAAIEAIMKDGWDMLRGRRLFWASLAERMTEDEAGEVMTDIGMAKSLDLVGNALRDAIKSLQGDAGGDAGNAARPRKAKAT